MTRAEVTDMIIAAKRNKKLSYSEIAKHVGQSKEWTTAALLRQMTLNEKQAAVVGEVLSLTPEAVQRLQEVPYKGSLPPSTSPWICNASLIPKGIGCVLS